MGRFIRTPKYKYRLVYKNPQVLYPPTHHLTLDKAFAAATKFWAPDNERACSPRYGHPYDSTKVVLEERTEAGGWVEVKVLR